MEPKTPHNFIGRKNEIGIYEDWLTDANAPKILYFYDAAPEPEKKGGIGKTRLLQECIRIAEEKAKDITIISGDFFSITDRNGLTIADRVYKQLKKVYDSWSADSFEKVLQEEKHREQQKSIGHDKNIDDSGEIRNELSEALISDLHDLDTHVSESQREGGKDILLVLDTFEVIQDNPSVAVISLKQKFPDNYQFDHIRFLIAGRNAINWTQPNWQGRKDEVKCVPLEPFNEDEIVQYMKSYMIPLEPHSKQIATLQQLTGGRPILLGLVKDLVGLNTVKLEDLLSVPPAEFEAHLVSQINNIAQPVNWFLLFMAHAYHRFNRSLLNWMLKISSLQGAVERLDEKRLENIPSLSFVRRATNERDDFTLHDEMRALVNKHCWENLDTDKSFRREVSRYMIQYYEEAQQDEDDDLKRQSYIIQVLYHKAFLDITEGLKYFKQHFDRAIDLWQKAYARMLLQEILKFKDLLSKHQWNDLRMEEARLLLKEENREMAFTYYNELLTEAEKDWIEAHKAEIYSFLGECHLALAEFDEAFRAFDDALKVEREQNNQKKTADTLNALGYISRRQGHFHQAVDYYQESISIYKKLGQRPAYLRELADIYNNLSNAYRLLGKIEAALIYCQQGLHLRERLFRNNEVSEVAVGLSHSTLGYIYLYSGNDVEAEKCLEMACDIFIRTNNKKGFAIYHNRSGLLQMKRGKLDEALKHFEIALENAANIDEEAQIISLNRQGQIYASRQKYKDAKGFFERAINKAIDAHDSYREAESRVDLARILANLKENKQYSEELKRATTIAKARHYTKRLGEIEKVQGDLFYQQRKYKKAFLHYAKLCHFMTQYNPIEYQEALRFLADRLLKVDDTAKISKALQVLRTYWQEEQLESTSPEFLRVCDEVSEVSL